MPQLSYACWNASREVGEHVVRLRIPGVEVRVLVHRYPAEVSAHLWRGEAQLELPVRRGVEPLRGGSDEIEVGLHRVVRRGRVRGEAVRELHETHRGPLHRNAQEAAARTVSLLRDRDTTIAAIAAGDGPSNASRACVCSLRAM